MRTLALVALVLASTCWARETNPQPPSPVPAQTPAAPQNPTITIPAGTRIPLALASPVSSKARHGDAVRAVTGFPVTVGTQLAIPAGTYVEGVIDKVTKGGRSGPTLQMHFTHILYANGYNTAIEGDTTQAEVLNPHSNPPEASTFASEPGPSYALAGASLPEAPTLQPLPSHTGAIVGLGIGGAAAVIAIAVLTRYHRGGSVVLFDTGWQFEMVLESPLSVDAASVAAATPGAP
ncbi:MAG: hypothetical protein ACLQVL_16980 [Terriglobia bacterium]